MSDIRLSEKDFEKLYQILQASVTNFDCGAICSKKNDGVPICCEVNVVIPVLYTHEFKYVSARCDLWREFVPEDKSDQNMIDDCGYDDVMVLCKGHKGCNRDYRSFVCRTFPFYPFISEEGVFMGMTYNYDFDGKCVLVNDHEAINKEYIRQFIEAWNYLFDIDEMEFEAHYDLCRDIEKKRKRERKPLHIINLEGVKQI